MTLPLAMPGLVSGALLVFAYNASAFAVPLLLGGRRADARRARARPGCTAAQLARRVGIGVVLMGATLVVMAVSQRLVRTLQRADEVNR